MNAARWTTAPLGRPWICRRAGDTALVDEGVLELVLTAGQGVRIDPQDATAAVLAGRAPAGTLVEAHVNGALWRLVRR